MLIEYVDEHVAGCAEKQSGLNVQKFIPERNPIIEMRNASQKERKEDEGNYCEFECEWKIQTISFLQDGWRKHDGKDERGAYRRLPIAPEEKNARRDENERAHAPIDEECRSVAIPVPYLCVDAIHLEV